jgi:Rrf2 family nitric oxide-sensitive transcriptional repressor
MLQLTKRTEYGLIALVHLVDRRGEPVSVRELSERYPVPKRLLAEVLKDLGRRGLVESHRGASGGYTLARAPESITLGDVVGALEGSPNLISCEVPALLRQASDCEVKPTCPIRSPIQRVHEGLLELLERTTLRSLADGPAATRAPVPTTTST